MPVFAPGATLRVIATEVGAIVRVDPDRPVLRLLAFGDGVTFVAVGVDLQVPDVEDESVPGMPILPEQETFVLKGHGANTLLAIGRSTQLFVTPGEIR